MYNWLQKLDQALIRESSREPIITKTLFRTLLAKDKLSIIDCGAAGGSLPEWSVIDSSTIMYGFEPDESECQRLNDLVQSTGKNHYYYPQALAGTAQKGRKFYITNHPQSCSLYMPNQKLIERWRQYPGSIPQKTVDNVGLKRITAVDTSTLDLWAQKNSIQEIDFIKMDVQGAELEILQGGSKLLSSALGLIVEVWFSPVYKDAPLFSDIDVFLRKENFSFFSNHIYYSGQFAGRTASPVAFKHMTTFREQMKAGQLVTTDAVYLRDILETSAELEKLSHKRILKLICIAELCQQVEYSFELLFFLHQLFLEGAQINEAKQIKEIIDVSSSYYSAKPIWAKLLRLLRIAGTRGPVLSYSIYS